MLLRKMLSFKKTRITMRKRPVPAKGLALIFFFCVIIRLAVYLGSDTFAEGLMTRLMENDHIALGIMDFELSGSIGSFGPLAELQLMFSAPGSPPADTPEVFAELETDAVFIAVTESSEITDEDVPYERCDSQPDNDAEDLRPYAAESYVRSADGIILINRTSLEIDIDALFAQPPDISLTRGEPAVLIIHTHTSEAFTPSDGLTYIASDPYRTEDQTRNIVRVGEEIAAEFERRGIGVIHDRRSYDFPSFAGSYSRAHASIRAHLERYPSIRLVLDIHRDSITAPDGSQRKTIAQIGDVVCAQIMLVVGSNYAGLNHPHWHENLRLALMLQYEMNLHFPSFARPIFISEFRFNQHATTGSLIIEVGSAGNSLTEALDAARFFAEAAANVILSFYE